jgi:hypothetical protein
MTKQPLPDLSALPTADLRALLSDYWNEQEEYDRIIAEIDRRKSSPDSGARPAPARVNLHTGRNSEFDTATAQRVIVEDVSMSFGSMVVFMVKWTLASIPAFLILFLLAVVVVAIFRTLVLG